MEMTKEWSAVTINWSPKTIYLLFRLKSSRENKEGLKSL